MLRACSDTTTAPLSAAQHTAHSLLSPFLPYLFVFVYTASYYVRAIPVVLCTVVMSAPLLLFSVRIQWLLIVMCKPRACQKHVVLHNALTTHCASAQAGRGGHNLPARGSSCCMVCRASEPLMLSWRPPSRRRR